jgi:hypothetical protein
LRKWVGLDLNLRPLDRQFKDGVCKYLSNND